VERRLADHTLESYARDLPRCGVCRRRGRAVESLDRQALELFVREQVTRGLSPRSVARTVAAVRGFYRFLVDRPAARPQPGRRPAAAARLAGAAEVLSLEEVDTLIAQPDVSTRSACATAR
jgi:site-specific recombinase XerD